jgi:hypothetical protein
LTEGTEGAVNGLSTSLEDGILAGRVRDTVCLCAINTDGDLEAGRETDVSNSPAKVPYTEFVSDGLTRAGNTQQLESISTPTDRVQLLVHHQAKGVDNGAGTLSDGNVVSKGKVVVHDGLGGGESGIDGVDAGVGEGKAEIPSVIQIHTTKEPLAVERILCVSKGAGDDTSWIASQEAHGSLNLPGAIEGKRVDGV